MGFDLKKLDRIIAERANSDPQESYSAKLLKKGVSQCAKKFGEEAFEIAISAVENDKTGVINEASDVLYHLLLLLRASDVELQDVMDELQKRTTRSGIEEKLSRQKSSF